MIVDAGVLVSVDRGDRAALSFRTAAERAGQDLHTTAPVVAQVWRRGSRQARLAGFLKTVTIHSFDDLDGRRVGEILGSAGTSDTTDAHLVVTAAHLGLGIVTGDTEDIELLAACLPTPAPAVYSWP